MLIRCSTNTRVIQTERPKLLTITNMNLYKVSIKILQLVKIWRVILTSLLWSLCNLQLSVIKKSIICICIRTHTCFNSSKMTNCWVCQTKCLHHNFQITSIALTQYKGDVIEILQTKPTLVLSQCPHLAYFLNNSFLTEKVFILQLCWNHMASRECCQETAMKEEVETNFSFPFGCLWSE